MQIEKMFLIDLANRDEWYRLAFMRNGTRKFYEWIDQRLSTQKNFILSFYGNPGSGKSYSGFFIALKAREKYGFKFDIDHIFWNSEDFLKAVMDAKGKETFLIDEQVALSQYGVGASRVEDTIHSIEDVVRKKQINIIFCSIRALEHSHHFKIWSTGILVKGEYSKHIVSDSVHDKPRMHIFTGDPRKIDPKLVKAYEKKKDEYIIAIQKGEARDPYEIVEQYTDDFLKNHPDELFKNKTELKLILQKHYKVTLTTTEWSNIATNIIMKMRESNEE